MLFSIIVPAYNEEKYIEQCLRSILQQTVDRPEYEIIVSDGASSDNTQTIAKQLSDKIVVNERRGASVQRNYGAQQAQGDILVFIDADTTLDKYFLSALKEQFKDQRVVAVSGIAYPADGNLPQRLVYRATYRLMQIFHFMNLSLFPAMCVAYRKRAFDDAGGFREDFTTLEDLDLSKRVSKSGLTKIAARAHAYSSTRRIQKHLVSTVAYHIFCDMRYLLTGKGPRRYPKAEEIQSWRDLWKSI
jgi:glycosyltransferase involved in cell wall biosynthesis